MLKRSVLTFHGDLISLSKWQSRLTKPCSVFTSSTEFRSTESFRVLLLTIPVAWPQVPRACVAWQSPASTVEVWREHQSAQCPGQHLGFVTVLWCPRHRAGLPWDSLQHTLQSGKGNRGLLSCCPCCHNPFHTKVTDNPGWLSAEGSALGNSRCVSDDAEQGWEEVQQQSSRMGMQLSLPCSEHCLAAVPRATSLLWVNTSWIPRWKLDQSLI